ncbi:MAG: glycosyltransferase family 4 protein [Phycisphaerae bacterium]|nr:glycosyltransferase family 4 protein [Phycisphaerae bacterium]
MVMQLTHVVDEDSGMDAFRGLSLLVHRLSGACIEQRVVAIGRPAVELPAAADLTRVARWDVNLGIPSRDLRRVLEQQYSGVVHAWGGRVAAAVRSVCPDGLRLVVTLSDPADAANLQKWWPLRRAGGNPCVICSCERVRQRLISSGLPREATVVVRPGVDADGLRSPEPIVTRSDLGLGAETEVFLTASPPSREGGQYYAAWAMAIVHQIRPDVRLIVPGLSREASRLGRLFDDIYCPEVFIPVGDRYSPAALLAVSDAMLFTPLGDVPTGWLAMAMAAGIPVIGTAVPSVTELITEGETGFLCEPGLPHRLAIAIREAMESGDELGRRAVAARKLAERLFDVGRYVQDHEQLLIQPRDMTCLAESQRFSV